jgi:DNA-binding GntR family transcriptional regulator
MVATTSTTRAELVHDTVRDEVLRGHYEPGQRLRLVELAQRFTVSQSVVREALARLAEQRLVVALPQQGFRVMSLSPDDLRDLTEARVEIEALVIRLAVRRGDVAWESAVVAAHHRLLRTAGPGGHPPGPTAGTGEDWFQVHEDYHRTLLAGCGNRRLTDLATSLRASASLYRRWSRFAGASYLTEVADEHRGVLEAVLARDADAAAEHLSAHIRHNTDVLLDRYESSPAGASDGPPS